MKRVLFALLLLAFPPGVSAQGVADPRAVRVDGLFHRFERDASPGLAVAVVRDGQVLLTKGYGLASLEHRAPITPSTVFDIASLSKQVTGLGIALLAEQGRLKLDDDIRVYIPELAAFEPPITIRHLLHHTSGLRDWGSTLSLAGADTDDLILSDRILTFAYAQRTLNFKPGTDYAYSNTGYVLLGELIRRVTGASYRAWTDETFFRPLGMATTHFRDDVYEVIPNRAFGYGRRPDGQYRALPNILAVAGAGTIFGTVEDMAKWAINLDDARIGGEAAMALSRTRVVLPNGTRLPYAFGIRHGSHRGLAALSHSGGNQGFRSHLLYIPEKRFAVVVMANGHFIDPDKAARDVAEIFLEGEVTTAMASTQAKVAVAPEALDAYVGIYRKSAGQYLKVTRDGDALKAQASVAECCTTSLDIAAMTARSQTDFLVAPHMLPIAFKRDESGQATQLIYRGWPYARVVAPVAAKPLADYVGIYDSAELHTSYTVEAKEGAPVMRHFRHGEIALNPGWATDFFLGGEWFMKSVEFERGADGQVAGVVFNLDDRAQDVRFVKRR